MNTTVRSAEISGARIMSRLQALASVSEMDGGLTRRYLTDQHAEANEVVGKWMIGAGMAVREDAVGNIIGRYEGQTAGLPALMVGSHLDTVVMAGRYDGSLGVIAGIECVRSLHEREIRLPFAVEVIGFADEEGVRFKSTYLGSRAVAGTFDEDLLARRDDGGMTMADAMIRYGLDPTRVAEAARVPEDVLAYLELHIEQGPVLEEKGLAVGAVTAIAGATRLVVTVSGRSGHAGTVAMGLRRDALAAASECVLAVEGIAAATPDVVGTVGDLNVSPGAVNVIPGKSVFTVDIRAAGDDQRLRAVEDLGERFQEIAVRRNVEIAAETVHDVAGVDCAPWIVEQINAATARQAEPVFTLFSGAGHDAAAMVDVTDVGMIFLRCAGGVSHTPEESITEADAESGVRLLLDVIENFETAPRQSERHSA